MTGKVTTKTTEHPQGERPTSGPALWAIAPKDRISEPLLGMVVDISTLTPDPVNARLHPERNKESIMDSLALYGQMKPVVVNKNNMVVMAGNGTMEAAVALGWTKIAAAISAMTEDVAIGYGLADNRTAELAKWDFAVVAQLDATLSKLGVNPIGWSKDELDVLRMADWVPPVVSEEGFGGGGDGSGASALVIGLTPDQHELITAAAAKLLAEVGKEMDLAEVVTELSKRFVGE